MAASDDAVITPAKWRLFTALSRSSPAVSPGAVRWVSQAASFASVLRPRTFPIWAAFARIGSNSLSPQAAPHRPLVDVGLFHGNAGKPFPPPLSDSWSSS
jgi:hypothetical protein